MRTFFGLSIIGIVVLAGAIFLLCISVLNDYPSNWSADLLTKNRDEIENVFGKPDGDFSAKDFIAWESFFWWGRRELRVDDEKIYGRENRPSVLYIDLSIGARCKKEYFAFIRRNIRVDSVGRNPVVLLYPMQIGSYLLYCAKTKIGLIDG